MKRLIGIFFLAGAAAAAAFTDRPWGAAQAQQAGDTPQTMPSLADIMSGTQWRHLKLAYSGKVTNWQLANYELGQIQHSFSAAAKLYPTFKSIPLAQLIKDESGPPCRSRQSDRAEELRGFHRGLYQAHRSVQSLPSGRESGLHRHPYPDVLPLRQSAVSPRTTVT